MGELTKKQLRIIQRALEGFFTEKAITNPTSFKDFKILDLLSRELRLDNNRVLLMTDLGLSLLKTIADKLYEADILGGSADYADIHLACVKVLRQCLSKGERPDNANEFVGLVRRILDELIDLHTFAVPIFGIKFVDIAVLDLGSFKIVPASVDVLAEAGVEDVDGLAAKSIELTAMQYWLVGGYRGTARVAEQKFRIHAELLVGILAVYAASMYRNGARAFRIGIVMSPEAAYGQSAWFSWAESNRRLITHRKFRAQQDLPINRELLGHLSDEGVLDAACRFFQADTRTPLEEAIVKAVYWYSEAHRELVPVMKLVKYWSAIETFFSINGTDITQSVSGGLASVLVFGGFAFVPPEDYRATRRRISDLYSARSRAVHRASYNHVSELDASVLSQWVAWMLINMVSFQMRGYRTLDEIKAHVDRLDAEMMNVSQDDVAQTP